MKSFFDESTFRYTCTANMVEEPILKEVRLIFETWVKLGYSPREISYLLQRAIVDIEMDTIIEMNYQESQANTQKKV